MHNVRHFRHPVNGARRGSVLIFVLSAATLAAAAGIAAILLHTERLQRIQLSVQSQKAIVDAQSALEFALAVVDQDPAGTTWRSAPALAFTDRRYFGADASVVSVSLTDPSDSDLSDSNLDPVTVSVSAVMGPCEQVYQVTVSPSLTPLSCLDYAVVVGGTLKAGTGNSLVYTGGSISAGRCWEVDSSAVPNVPDTLNMVARGTDVPGQPVTVLRMPLAGGAPVRSGVAFDAALFDAKIPNATDLFKYYASIGTPIAYSALSGGGELRNVVLSSGQNPFGATNAQGIYVIDCGGSDITLRNCRVAGTLVLLNTGAGSLIRDSACLEAASDGFPALLVQGGISFQQVSGDLSESTIAANLNPAGAPFDGASDSDTSDTYPSWIKGLVYVSGSATLQGQTTINGVIVVKGGLAIASTSQLRVLYTKPPAVVPGFAEITGMGIVRGTLQRVIK